MPAAINGLLEWKINASLLLPPLQSAGKMLGVCDKRMKGIHSREVAERKRKKKVGRVKQTIDGWENQVKKPGVKQGIKYI